MSHEIATNNEECLELKSIKYKSMLLNGKQIQETTSENNLSNLDKFLENEKNNNFNEPWCKLNRTDKMKKLVEFVEIYKTQKNLDDEECEILTEFLKDSIERKKLQRVRDVLYDKNTGSIKDIVGLCYTRATKHFTLKNIDKRVSTFKSLPPKKTHGTIKNKSILTTKNLKTSTSSDNDD